MSFRTGLNAALFSSGFVMACAAISTIVPLQKDIPVVSEKLEWLSLHGSDYDTLFAGSSRVFHQVMPTVFDARMQELGHIVRSFNIGADGMNFPETLHMIELAARRLPRLKTVVVEMGNMQRTVTDESRRSEYWHTPRFTKAVIESICSDDSAETGTKAAQIWKHLSLFARTSTSLGRGQEWLDIKLPTNFRREEIGNEGCLTIDRQMSPADTALFSESLAAKKAGAKGVVIRDPALEELLADFVERMSATGINVTFVKLPAFRKFVPMNPSALTLDFDDLEKFPNLWSAELRYDPAHLNTTGAEILSRLLADEFAKRLEARD